MSYGFEWAMFLLECEEMKYERNESTRHFYVFFYKGENVRAQSTESVDFIFHKKEKKITLIETIQCLLYINNVCYKYIMFTAHKSVM